MSDTHKKFDFTDYLFGSVVFVLIIPAGFYYVATLAGLPLMFIHVLLVVYALALFIGTLVRINQLPGQNHDR